MVSTELMTVKPSLISNRPIRGEDRAREARSALGGVDSHGPVGHYRDDLYIDRRSSVPLPPRRSGMNSAHSNPRALLPLTHLTYHVLLAMADRPLHGYGIIREVEQRTDGILRVEAGTLYAALKRMTQESLIEPVAEDGRRRNYRLTEYGRAVLVAESDRLDRLVTVARDKRVLSSQIG